MTKTDAPRHLLVFVAPQKIEGFRPNLVIDSVDAPIDEQISQYRAMILGNGSRILIDRTLHCQAHVRGHLLETVKPRHDYYIDAVQLQIGRVDRSTSYSVTYSRGAQTPVNPSAQASLTSLCYERTFDTTFIDTSPNLLPSSKK